MFDIPLKKIFQALTASTFTQLGLLLITTIFFLQENDLRDWRFWLRGENKAINQLLVVTLDETYAHNMDYPDRVPRDYLADLINLLKEYDARVIALNYEFRVADRQDAHYDRLKNAINNAGNIVLPSQLNPKEKHRKLLEVPPFDLQAISLNGYSDLTGKKPIYMEQYRQLANDGPFVPTFALAAIAGFLAPDTFFQRPSISAAARHEDIDQMALKTFPKESWEAILQKCNYPASGEYQYSLDYFGPVREKFSGTHTSEKLFRIAREDSLEWARAYLREVVSGKLVLVGSLYSQENDQDEFQTPFGTMQSVEVHANIVNNLLEGTYPTDLTDWEQLGIAVLTFLLGILAVRYLSLTRATILVLGALLFYCVLGIILFPQENIFLPLATPIKTGLIGFFLSYLLAHYGPVQKKIRQYLDFDLLIYPHNQKGKYQLRLIDGPGQAGNPRATMTANNSEEFQDAITRLQRNHTDSKLLKSFGQSLYNMLLSGDLSAAYQRAITQARQGNKGLHIRLRMDDPELRALPWEYLYDSQFNYFMAAHPEVIFSRYVESNTPIRLMNVDSLKVLIVISDPTPESSAALNLNPIDAEYEKRLITSALDRLNYQKMNVEYDILMHAVPEEISAQLENGYQVLHFIGHSTFGKSGGKIIMENEKHEMTLQSGQYFGDLIAGQNDLRLVVMNSCKSAVTANRPEINGIAYQIVECGVPSVVAMQYNIPDEVAILFSREFYRNLAKNASVALATTRARAAILREFRQNRPRDFGIPVLFLRSGEGEENLTDE